MVGKNKKGNIQKSKKEITNKTSMDAICFGHTHKNNNNDNYETTKNKEQIIYDDLKNEDIKEKDTKCAPDKPFSSNSCIPLEILLEMAKAYNKEYPDNKINIPKNGYIILYRSLSKKYLVKQFKEKLKNLCNDQVCWTQQEFINRLSKDIKNELTNFTFRPTGPQGTFEWLNTNHIDNVLKQYEKVDKEFIFLGAVPIDFDLLKNNVPKNEEEMSLLKKSKIGIVFNLDKHNESGSHWVALYANLNKGLICYYDSYGIRPCFEIRVFMRRIASFCYNYKKIKILDLQTNKTRHQYGNSECGVYSINFIIRMLTEEDPEKIAKIPLPDGKVNLCRMEYFNNVTINNDNDNDSDN